MLDQLRRVLSRILRLSTAQIGVLFFVLFGVLVWAQPIFAQTAWESFSQSTILPKVDLLLFVARLIRAVLGIIGIVFVVIVLYAGYIYMTSQGDPAKTKKSKAMIRQAAIGAFIMLSAYTIASFVIGAILGVTGGGQGISQAVIEKYTEPLAGSLGAGVIENHYPARNAIDIPRNTKIFVTFSESMDPTTLIQGYDMELSPQDSNQSKLLKTDTVFIFETAKGQNQKLTSDKVLVSVMPEADPQDPTQPIYKTFVFDPVDLLGNPTTDTNYSVSLQPGIKKADGGNAFAGAYAAGYEWTFEVSTIIDLTPPYVVSWIPAHNSTQDRNTIVELTFNEAVDPLTSAGIYTEAKGGFTNIAVLNDAGVQVGGAFTISNNYRTVGFVTDDPCGEDPCGDEIYCFDPDDRFDVIAKAASIDPVNPPQALAFDGVTDAAGNSLDGNGDGKACGSSTDAVTCEDGKPNDHFTWSFATNNTINLTVPQILSLSPDMEAENIDQVAPLNATFTTLLQGSSISSQNVSLWPDPVYPLWFYSTKTDDVTEKQSTISINHPPFISDADEGHLYYPVMTRGLKSAHQICFYPAKQVGKACNGADPAKPYCCNGQPSASACMTSVSLPPVPLPLNIE